MIPPHPSPEKRVKNHLKFKCTNVSLFVTFERRMNRAKWHACPRTAPKYKSSAEHLSCLCIWSFLPLSSNPFNHRLLEGPVSNQSLSNYYCSSVLWPGLQLKSQGPRSLSERCVLASPCSGAPCSFCKGGYFSVIFLLLSIAVSDRKGWTRKKCGWYLTGSVQSFVKWGMFQVHLNCQKGWTCQTWEVCWAFVLHIDRSPCV